MDSVRRRATGGFDLCVGRTAHLDRAGADAVRYWAGLARTRRTAEPGDRGEAAVEQSADSVGDDLGRVGPDADDQCRPMVVGSEGVEGDPFPPIRWCRILTV